MSLKKIVNKHEFVQRVFTESKKMCEAFYSCETEEQLNNTQNWADGVMHRWNFLVNGWKQSDCEEVTPMVNAANNDISESYNKVKSFIEEQSNEWKRSEFKDFVVTGFC